VEAFFERRGDELVPGSATVSVWSPDMLDGRSVVGLAGWAVEQQHGEPGLQVARLTVDLFRAAPRKPLRVLTRPVRSGRRIRMVEAGVLDGEVEVARATALLLARGEQPEAAEGWSPPSTMPGPDTVGRGGMGNVGWEVRRVTPWGRGEPGRVWLREEREFVAGEEVTPFLRAALAADFTNPMVNSSGRGLAFINTDVTLYLVRDPRSEWVGLSSIGHVSDGGIASGAADVFDVDGRIGYVTVSALADPRLRERGGPPKATG
jgi:hypothetical protein